MPHLTDDPRGGKGCSGVRHVPQLEMWGPSRLLCAVVGRSRKALEGAQVEVFGRALQGMSLLAPRASGEDLGNLTCVHPTS